jgi:phenylacetate-CoA ligase
MNKHFLKNLRDGMPESLRYISAPLIRNSLIRNEEFLKYYRLLENRELLSHEKIGQYQFEQLKKILNHSYQNVPYYTNLFRQVSFDPADFTDLSQMEKIPFLTRDLVVANFNKLISQKSISGGYYVGSTGGSSGLPLKFYLDYNSIYRENAFIYYFRKKAGYKFSNKLATFRQVGLGDKMWRYDPMYNEIIFSPVKLSVLSVHKYINRINDYGPEFINGYLSVIWFFARLLEESGLRLKTKLKGIFLMSENVDEKQRAFIEQVFKVKSFVHYGHSERCVLAEGVTDNKYKFDPYYGFTEQVHICDDIYSIVGTGFLNYIMPFIRYKTDDTCTPSGEWFEIHGKRSSTIGLVGKNDEHLTAAAFDLDNAIFRDIIAYQFIQREKGKAELHMIVNNAFQKSDLEVVRKEIYVDTQGVIDFDIKIVDHLILTPRGKSKMFISYLDENS